MIPKLISIGPFTVYSYGFLLFLGFIAGIVLARSQAEKFGLKPDAIYDLAFWAILLEIRAVYGSALSFFYFWVANIA